MEDLRASYHNNKVNRQVKFSKLLQTANKNKYKILIFFVVLVLLIFPTFMGTIIGKWITCFFGSIIKSIAL